MKNRISEYIIYFMAYSIIGWLYETVLEVVVYHWGFSNRGVLFGPWLPVYGVGAVLFLLLWYRLIKSKPLKKRLLMIPVIFILTMLTATAVELLASYFCEWLLGSWPWQTYKNYAFNFQGRIALNPSIRFGIGGVVFLYIIQPALDKLPKKLGECRVKYISAVIAIVLLMDIAISVAIG